MTLIFRSLLTGMILLLFCLAAPAGAQTDRVASSADSQRTASFRLTSMGADGLDIVALQRPITLALDRVTLEAALEEIARQAELRLAYRHEILPLETRVSIRADQITAGDALVRVLRDTGLDALISPEGHVALVVAPPTAPTKPAAGTIAGRVTDSMTEAPLLGVSITVVETQLGALTGTDGRYTINGVPAGTYQVQASLLGYAEQTVESVQVDDGQTVTVDFQLAPEAIALAEVVAVGYGTQRTAVATGSVSSVTSEQLANRPVNTVGEALQGAAAGLLVTRTSDRPGNEGLDIQIRGATSVNDVDPLIVVDGVATSNGEEFLRMNAEDIESISVLKDASASIYGARAAGGVILVTTKNGQGMGAPRIDYRGDIRVRQPGRTDYISNMQQYGTMFYQAVQEDGTGDYWIWSRELVEGWMKGEPSTIDHPQFGPGWRTEPANVNDYLYGRSFSQQHYLSVTGSGENTNYRISGSLADNAAVLKTAFDGERRYTFRGNYGHNVTDAISVSAGMSYINSNVEQPQQYGIGENAGVNDAPIFPVKTPQGNWYDKFGYRNPAAITSDGGRIITGNSILTLNFEGTAALTDFLGLRGTAAFTSNDLSRESYWQPIRFYDWNEEVTAVQNPEPDVQRREERVDYQSYGGFLDYNQVLGGNHGVTALLGITAEHEHTNWLGATRGNLLYEGLTNIATSDPSDMTNDGGESEWGLLSYVGRVNHAYKDKYLLQVLGRRDASSRFAPGHKWSNFFGASGGWVISEEGFMPDFGVIDRLKIRLSYGETGGQSGLGLYDYLPLIGSGTHIFGESYARQQTAWIGGLTTTSRTWERIKNKNLGVDFQLLDNRLTGSFDYFLKTNDGMLIDVIYPAVLGGDAPATNNGVLETKGWELQLGWRNQINELFYEVSFNFSDTRNELVSMEGADAYSPGVVFAREGYPLNSIWVYETDGLFSSQDEVDDYYDRLTQNGQGELPSEGNTSETLRPGDTRKVDRDGNGYISALGGADDAGDIYFFGDADPHYSFGIDLAARWKGIDVRTFFQGVLQQYLVRDGLMPYPFFRIWTNQPPYFMGKTWTDERSDAKYPRLTTNGRRAAWNYADNDFMVQNARYVRLKSLVLGYTLPEYLIQGIGVERLRVYFAGNDLWERTGLDDGYDPEYGASTRRTYPFSRTFSLGVDLTF